MVNNSSVTGKPECCTGQCYDEPLDRNQNNTTFAYSFDRKWYACINGQLKLIPQQCSDRNEALCATRAMMQEMESNNGK